MSTDVSVLTLLGGYLGSANDLSGEECRYNRHYEKAMGIQEKGHQGMVVWLVRRRQEKSQSSPEQGTGGALPPYEVRTAQLRRVY